MIDLMLELSKPYSRSVFLSIGVFIPAGFLLKKYEMEEPVLQ